MKGPLCKAVRIGALMTDYADCTWTSRDGLILHYREYGAARAPAGRPPVLCLPGLTRNGRDFAQLAARIAGDWRVLCLDMRGRGDSAYARDTATYTPHPSVDDVEARLEQLGVTRFVAIGTSLGGLMTLAMAAAAPDRIAGAAINDIGPRLETTGLDRIKGYVGQGRSFPTWMHAARALEEMQGGAHPDWGVGEWLDMAKRLMTLTSNGRIVFDYDMKIAEPFADFADAAMPDLWPGIDALRGKPALLLRGELSDLLSEATLAEMAARLPGAEVVRLAGVGHAPTLDEPEAVAGVARLLARIG